MAAIACCARRSASADPRRRPVNNHTITPPASTSIRLSMPKPISAIDPAQIPAGERDRELGDMPSVGAPGQPARATLERGALV